MPTIRWDLICRSRLSGGLRESNFFCRNPGFQSQRPSRQGRGGITFLMRLPKSCYITDPTFYRLQVSQLPNQIQGEETRTATFQREKPLRSYTHFKTTTVQIPEHHTSPGRTQDAELHTILDSPPLDCYLSGNKWSFLSGCYCELL